jgi:nucleoside-diphosphate-sugar epimerase
VEIELSTPPVLITGSTGFLGRHIVEQMHAKGHNLLHLGRTINNLCLDPHDHVIQGDITQPGNWQEQIEKDKPDTVIHCAGSTSGTIEELLISNVESLQNIINVLGNDVHYILVSSGAVYGDTSLHESVNEKFATNPLSDYARSKVDQELILKSNCSNYSIMRLSNPIGPKQSRNFFVGNCINQILSFKQKKEKANTLTVGDLNATRDFIDCRDVASAIALVHEHKPQGVFNLSSGKSELLKGVIEHLVKISGIKINIEINNQLGKNAIKHQCLDNSTLQKAISWRPNITIRESLRFALEMSR